MARAMLALPWLCLHQLCMPKILIYTHVGGMFLCVFVEGLGWGFGWVVLGGSWR